ncbi:hypothetical protein LguiA_003756 [Lonicera macranthoides]
MNSIIAGFFAFFLFLYYLSSKLKTPKVKVPQQAGGAWPIIGHLHLLGASHQMPHEVLGAMADKYGPIFTIKVGVKPALVVSSWEVAKELYTIHDLAISSRPKFVASYIMGYDLAMFSQSPYGAYWREIRKIASLELLSRRRLELMKHVRVSEIKAFIRDLYKLWMEKKNDTGHVMVEMKQWFGELNLNVMLRMVAGKRYFGDSATSAELEEAEQCRNGMRELFRLLGLFVVADAVPLLRFLDLGGYEKEMKKTAKDIDLIIQGWLDDHRRKRNSGETTSDQDFIDVLLTTLNGVDKLGGYDIDDVLIAGSTDTTTIMLTWALALIMNDRNVLEKAQEELDIHVGKERKVKESDINNLVYLQAIVKETLRLYPAGQLGGPREFDEDCNVYGYHIPKGTRLIVNLWKLHRDPRIWPDPLEFKPERFLTTHKDIDVKGHDYELLPFGAGRRMCPGYTFGLQMLHLSLASLLQGFELSTPGNAPVDMTEDAGLTNMKATPFEVLLSPRLSPNLY